MRWDANYLRYLIAIYPYLEAGRWPPSDRAADRSARGVIPYGSRPPTPTVLVKATLDQAIGQLDEPYRSVVRARIVGRSLGRAARLLHRRKADVSRDYETGLKRLVLIVRDRTPVEAGARVCPNSMSEEDDHATTQRQRQ